MRFTHIIPLSLLLLTSFTIGGCGVETEIKQTTANQIARPAFMVERKIDAGQFDLNAWERMHQRYAPATVYIEGLGLNEVSQNSPYVLNNMNLINPEPSNPLALYLASRDKSKNVAYLTRPCQYVVMPEEKGCDSTYWQEKRFSPEIITAYQDALNDIAARYNITKFNLVGYDGGANIAAILAGSRNDVASLRTVAGNLDPSFGSTDEKFIPLSDDAVMSVDYARQLAQIPQHHFIGAADQVVTPGNYHSYRQALGLSECVHYSLIQDADHIKGWVEKWPDLLKLVPQCPQLHDNLPPLPPSTADFPNSNLHKGLGK